MAPRTPRAHEDRRITLADGRALVWRERGDPGGHPVIYCHGYPGCRLEVGLVAEAAQRVGVRLIAPDRPGFGGSSRHPSRGVDDWPRDLAQLLDALGLERCRVLGMSGGGPYALACGVVLGRRVEAIGLMGSLGPLESAQARRAMAPLARLSLHLAQRHPSTQAALFHGLATALRLAPAAMLRLMMTGETAADRAALARPGRREVLLAGMRGAIAQGARPAIEELRAYVAPWPFTPERITAPVWLWHGEADPVVPPSHGRSIAACLPHGTANFMPGEGHFSLPIEHGDPILRALVDAAA